MISVSPPDNPSAIKCRCGTAHFFELAEKRPAVVCPIHLGLMRGALESWRAPLTVTRLEAFAEPDLCVAHLAPKHRAKGEVS